jgi:hypothetical protein
MVAPKLRIVARDQLETSQSSLTKLFNDWTITKIALHIPVRGYRAKIDDAHMRTGSLRVHLFALGELGGCIFGRLFGGFSGFSGFLVTFNKALFQFSLGAPKIPSDAWKLRASENH